VNRKAEQAERTRRALLDAARVLFGARGYDATKMEDVSARAGVTTGALYNLFAGKRDLFAAVYAELGQELVERARERQFAIATAADEPDAEETWAHALAIFEGMLDGYLQPGAGRILHQEGPAVLGWEGARGLFTDHALRRAREGLENLMARGTIQREPIEPLAHMIHAVLTEAGMLIATADDPAAARVEVGASVLRFLGRLRCASSGATSEVDRAEGAMPLQPERGRRR
jgi:AcrR family transcriptional regulator